MEIDNVVHKSKFVYPVARREESIVDDYHGKKVEHSLWFQTIPGTINKPGRETPRVSLSRAVFLSSPWTVAPRNGE